MEWTPEDGKADQHVARRHIPGQQGAALGRADGKARQIVVAAGVEARHLRGFAAHSAQPAWTAAVGDAPHDGDADLRRELAGGEIVEEEQRLGALHDDVVDAHRHQIDADGVVNAGVDGDLDLGADPVIGRNQDRVREARRLQIEQSAEAADFRVGSGAARGAHQRLDLVHHGVARVDIDARLRVGQAVRQFLGHRSPRLKAGSKARGGRRQGKVGFFMVPDGSTVDHRRWCHWGR